MSLWDQVKANMLEWYGTAAERTEEMARIGVRKYDKLTLSRTLERTLMQLGRHAYGALRDGRTDFAGDPEVRVAVSRIRDLEEQLAVKEQEIAEIRAAAQARGAGVPMAGAGRARPDASGPSGGGDALRQPPPDAVAPTAGDEADAESELDFEPAPTPGGEMVLDAWEDELAGWEAAPEDLGPEGDDRDGRKGRSEGTGRNGPSEEAPKGH